MVSLHHLPLSSTRGQSRPRHGSPMPTRGAGDRGRPREQVLRGEQHAVADDDDDELDPRGDRAGVGFQDGMDQRRHVKGHAVDRHQRPDDDCGVPVPRQGAFRLRREDLLVEGAGVVARTGGRLLVTSTTSACAAASNSGK